MKTLAEHLLVAVVAIAMAIAGAWCVDLWAGKNQLIELHDIGWTAWLCGVSILTWMYLYRVCRRVHWLVLPAMGLISPLIGCLLFFPLSLWAWFVVIENLPVVLFVGIVTGFVVSAATLPFRPKEVLFGNA